MFDLMLQLAANLFGRVDAPRGLASQPLRARLLQMIEDKPGLHASGLQRETGEPWGTVQYHLSLLEKAELVSAVDTGRERHFFPPGMDTRRTRLVALLGHGRRGDVARYVREHPGSRQVDVCEGVDMSRKTFRGPSTPSIGPGSCPSLFSASCTRRTCDDDWLIDCDPMLPLLSVWVPMLLPLVPLLSVCVPV